MIVIQNFWVVPENLAFEVGTFEYNYNCLYMIVYLYYRHTG